MVDPKVENKGADALEKEKDCWDKYKKKPKASTQDTSGKEKFEGASDDMKGNVFSIGRNQADVHATTMAMLEIVVEMKYIAVVASAIRDLKERPVILKIPVKPELTTLQEYGTLESTDTAVPDNLMNLYKEKMKMYAREEKKFELDCQSVYLLVKGQCSPKIISELKGFDDFDTIKEEFHLINLLKLIKKIYYNYKT